MTKLNAQPSPLRGSQRTPAKRAKWRAKHLANRAKRAAVNQEFKGEAKGRESAYHSALKSLNLGLAT